MADKEVKITTEAKDAKEEKPAIPSTLNVPTEPQATTSAQDKGRSRSTSPVVLSSRLIIKAKTQVGRFKSLCTLKTQLPAHAHSTSLEEVMLLTKQVEETHQEFCREHEHFETVWPAKFLDHEYFATEVAVQERQLVWELKLHLNRLKEDVQVITDLRAAQTKPAPARATKLPEIELPKFSGSYVDWPTFSELFTSLIIQDAQLMDIDRLHYLRSSLSGEPARRVNAYPLRGSSFQACWDMLAKRFANKRLLIQEQLDKLLTMPPITTRCATSLKDLAAMVNQVDESLVALNAHEEMYNCILVHTVTKALDKVTREAWETSLAGITEYPKYDKLLAFIEAKSSALEQTEASTKKSASTPAHSAQKKVTAHASTTSKSSAQPAQRPRATAYPCDVCKGDHFMVMCPQFRGMTVEARRKVIIANNLCKNCCGRHQTEVCKSAMKCKTCGARHHTMLHLHTPSAQAGSKPPAQQQAAQGSSQ